MSKRERERESDTVSRSRYALRSDVERDQQRVCGTRILGNRKTYTVGSFAQWVESEVSGTLRLKHGDLTDGGIVIVVEEGIPCGESSTGLQSESER